MGHTSHMQSTTGVAGKPIYIGAVIASAVLALAGYIYALTKNPTTLLRGTGTAIVPSHAFYLLQGLVFLCVAAYIYRLWKNRCDVHANSCGSRLCFPWPCSGLAGSSLVTASSPWLLSPL